MPGFNFQSLFSEDPERQLVSGPGASGDWRIKPRSLMDEDADPRFPAFQQAWKRGAGLGDLFGPEPFKLQGTVAPSGGDNTRADVAKVQTLLGKAGYLDLGQDGPSGYANPDTDKAIRSFQQDNDLQVDGVLKPNGPTIAKLGGLLGGVAQVQAQPFRYPMDEKPGGHDPWDVPGATPPYLPVPKPRPQSYPTADGQPGDILDILTGGKPWPKPSDSPSGAEPPGRPTGQPQGQPKLVRGELSGLISEIPDDPAEYKWYLEYPDGTRVPTSPPPRDNPWGKKLPTPSAGDPPERSRADGLFPGHTINQEGMDANQAYAEMLLRDSDPSQSARMLKRAIDDYGDQGRGDVADLLARLQKLDGGKADTLRREIQNATGEMLPYRLAPLGEGFREPTEEEKIAAAPKTPFGSAHGADRWAAGTMAEALLGRGDYADAITHFRGEIGRNRAEAMPYLAAVHQIMDDKNPALAAKFATQMSDAGLTDGQENGPDDGKIHLTLGPSNLAPEAEEEPGGGDIGEGGHEGGDGAGDIGQTDSGDTGNAGYGGDTQEEQIASTGDNVETGSGGAEGQSEGHQPADLNKFKDQAIRRGKGYGTGHCVDLVRTANPDLPRSTEWQEGSKIKGTGSPPLKPGTAIATFDEDGKYHGERRTGQHAAIFLEYATENGKPGMTVLDQWLGQPPHVRFIPFDDGKKRQNNAGAYSVIK